MKKIRSQTAVSSYKMLFPNSFPRPVSQFKTLDMNRFEFAAGVLLDGETVVIKHDSVKIYDGHEKVKAETT